MDDVGSSVSTAIGEHAGIDPEVDSVRSKTVALDARFVPGKDYSLSADELSFKTSDAAAYLVEFGNTSYFSAVQKSFSVALGRRSPTQLDVTRIDGVFNKSCWIVVAICDARGDVRHLERLSLTRKSRVTIPVQDSYSRVCFAVRLAGEGCFRAVEIRVRQPDGSDSTLVTLEPDLRPERGRSDRFAGFQASLHRMRDRYVSDRWVQWAEKIAAVRAEHRRRINAEPRLLRPVLFSEKMQWRKLFDAKPLYTRLSDKLAVRSYIGEHGFADLLVPVLWVGEDASQIDFERLPRPFIIKSTHGSGHVIFVRRYDVLDPGRIAEKAKGWLDLCFGTSRTAPGYVDVPRRLIIEPLLRCRGGEPPSELKLFVFDGRVRFLEYVRPLSDRERQISYLTADLRDLGWRWNALPGEPPTPPPLDPWPTRSAVLDESFRVAEALTRGMDHCRVDFYVQDDRVFIGELTLYSWSGWAKFMPRDADAVMGAFWTIRWPVLRAAHAVLFKRWAG